MNGSQIVNYILRFVIESDMLATKSFFLYYGFIQYFGLFCMYIFSEWAYKHFELKMLRFSNKNIGNIGKEKILRSLTKNCLFANQEIYVYRLCEWTTFRYTCHSRQCHCIYNIQFTSYTFCVNSIDQLPKSESLISDMCGDDDNNQNEHTTNTNKLKIDFISLGNLITNWSETGCGKEYEICTNNNGIRYWKDMNDTHKKQLSYRFAETFYAIFVFCMLCNNNERRRKFISVVDCRMSTCTMYTIQCTLNFVSIVVFHFYRQS